MYIWTGTEVTRSGLQSGARFGKEKEFRKDTERPGTGRHIAPRTKHLQIWCIPERFRFARRRSVRRLYAGWESGVFRFDIVFDGHVSEFTGIKDVATFLALDKFRVFFACHNAYAWVPTDFFHIRYFRGSLRGRWSIDCAHIRIKAARFSGASQRIFGIFMREWPLVKQFCVAKIAPIRAMLDTMDEEFRSRVAESKAWDKSRNPGPAGSVPGSQRRVAAG